MTTMPFGKHKGTALGNLPDHYLLWFSLLPDLRDPLLTMVNAEMDRRNAAACAKRAP